MFGKERTTSKREEFENYELQMQEKEKEFRKNGGIKKSLKSVKKNNSKEKDRGTNISK